jgi:RNA polymerase sigma-70 factor (ECF subfamily)
MAKMLDNIRTAEKMLVLKAQTGDVSAFAALYRAYHPSLVNFARRLSQDPYLSEDAVQEAWITISKTLHRLDNPSRFRSWVFKTVRWRLIDVSRKKGKQLTALDDLDFGVEAPQNLHLDKEDLCRLIQKLPVIEREAVYLFYLEGFSLQEISEVLNIPSGTVKSRLSRARHNLHKAYQASENITPGDDSPDK